MCSFVLPRCRVYLPSRSARFRHYAALVLVIFVYTTYHGFHSLQISTSQTTISQTTSVCRGGWRQTGECRGDGPRQPDLDEGCDKLILPERSGFCECKDETVPFDCGGQGLARARKEMTCNDVCAGRLPTDATSSPISVVQHVCRGGWRQTGECRGDGPRQPDLDEGCDKLIMPERSGFCECSACTMSESRTIAFGCGQAKIAFTCDEVCLALAGRRAPQNEVLHWAHQVMQTLQKLLLKLKKQPWRVMPFVQDALASLRVAHAHFSNSTDKLSSGKPEGSHPLVRPLADSPCQGLSGGWHQTGDCWGNGVDLVRVPAQDKSCDKIVSPYQSGFCDCGNKNVTFDCIDTPVPFTCNEACSSNLVAGEQYLKTLHQESLDMFCSINGLQNTGKLGLSFNRQVWNRIKKGTVSNNRDTALYDSHNEISHVDDIDNVYTNFIIQLQNQIHRLFFEELYTPPESNSSSRIPKRLYFNHKLVLYPEQHDVTLDGNDQALKRNVARTVQILGATAKDVVFLDDLGCAGNMLATQQPSAKELLLAFYKEQDGRLRSDMCRLVQLWDYGGYYFDTDILTRRNPQDLLLNDDMMSSQISFVTIKAADLDCNRSQGCQNPSGFFQAFMGSTARHPLLDEAIDQMIEWYRNGQYNITEVRRVSKGHPVINLGVVLLRDAFKTWAGNAELTTLEKSGRLNSWHNGQMWQSRLFFEVHFDDYDKKRKLEYFSGVNVDTPLSAEPACRFVVVDKVSKIAPFQSRAIRRSIEEAGWPLVDCPLVQG